MNREELLKVAKPMLFSTEMVRAILDRRKTMTRRIIKIDNPDEWEAENDLRKKTEAFGGSDVPCYICRKVSTEERGIYYPKHDVGDVIYVRETWYQHYDGSFVYKASQSPNKGWKPSIFMPKEAARIFLKVNGVRVERIQNITGLNCLYEGIHEPYACRSESGYEFEMRTHFKELWNGINAKRGYGWDTNPWVWVYEFEMLGV